MSLSSVVSVNSDLIFTNDSLSLCCCLVVISAHFEIEP